MNTSTRRALLRKTTASAAVLAFSPVGKLLAQTPDAQRTVESQMTGSIIELIDESWNFELGFGGMEEGDEYIRELYLMDTETAALEVEFVLTDLTPEQYLELVQERYQTNWNQFELADSGRTADGLWFAASAANTEIPVSVYCELQVGAFEQADLMITLLSEPPVFAESVTSAQEGVLIGDLEPFIMVEPSEVLSLEFPALAIATATESTRRSSRTTRGTQSGSESEQDTSRRSNRRGQEQSTATADSDYVSAVREHREAYLDTFTDFLFALGIFADEASTDDQLDQAFETFGEVAEIWITYPDQASQLTAPPEYAELESVYLTWADEIGALGEMWFAFVAGNATVDDLFNQLDVVDAVDAELDAALQSL